MVVKNVKLKVSGNTNQYLLFGWKHRPKVWFARQSEMQQLNVQ